MRVCGAKNAVLPVLAAALLTDEPLVVPNAPRLSDVRTMLAVLGELGCATERADSGEVRVQAPAELDHVAGWEYVRRMRGSVCILGPLLARTGQAKVSLPGGCVFGVRPIDAHLRGFEALGAKVRIEHGYVVAEAPEGGLRGAELFLGTAFGSTVLGTANVMMAATLAKGRTGDPRRRLRAGGHRPRRVACVAMGAQIEGLGSPRIVHRGRDPASAARPGPRPARPHRGRHLRDRRRDHRRPRDASKAVGPTDTLRAARPNSTPRCVSRSRLGADWIESQLRHRAA